MIVSEFFFFFHSNFQILEITVRHFQRHRNLENPELDKYKAGYTDCMREIARYLATPEPGSANTPSLTDSGSKTRLLRHLDNCIAEINAEIKDTKIPIELSKSPIPQPSLIDSSSQDSTPLDFSKTGRKFQTTKTETKPKIVTSPHPQIPQDENNNRDNEKPDSYPVSVITIPKKKAAMSRGGQTPSKRLKVGVDKKVEVASSVSSGISSDSSSVQESSNSNGQQIEPTKSQSVLLLPSHYVQLATGEFFDL